jgi:hypothetical protein
MNYELLGGGDIPITMNQSLGPFNITDVPSNAFLVYTAGYVIVLLLWGCYRFSGRDI